MSTTVKDTLKDSMQEFDNYLASNPNIPYDEFFEIAWDYVSTEAVDDTIWEKKQALLRAVTFDIYQLQEKAGSINPKFAGKVLESIFLHIKNF